MNQQKYEKIRNFCSVWEYRPADIADYLERISPGMATKHGQQMRKRKNDAFWNGFLGRSEKLTEAKPIPRPADGEEGIARDLWVLLSVSSDDPVTLDDLADFTTEHMAKTVADKERKAGEDSMFMSGMLQNLNQEEYARDQAWFNESFANSERLKNEKTDMNSFMRNLSSGCDSTPCTMRIGDVDNAGGSMSAALRNLDPDRRV